MSISSQLREILSTLPPHVTLVAVSKTQPLQALEEAYAAGQRIFGENKIQEMADKYEALPKDIEWHMIGHVQSNKVKYMAPFVKLVHGVDSLKLLQEIDRQAKKNDRVIDCLLQLHIAEEDTKFGLSESELAALLSSSEFSGLHNIRLRGLMGMATFSDDENQVKKEFDFLKTLFETSRNRLNSPDFDTLSMGMSGDYELAIASGSTMVRIGSSIFGNRN